MFLKTLIFIIIKKYWREIKFWPELLLPTNFLKRLKISRYFIEIARIISIKYLQNLGGGGLVKFEILRFQSRNLQKKLWNSYDFYRVCLDYTFGGFWKKVPEIRYKKNEKRHRSSLSFYLSMLSLHSLSLWKMKFEIFPHKWIYSITGGTRQVRLDLMAGKKSRCYIWMISLKCRVKTVLSD